jgi:hypothetical protein
VAETLTPRQIADRYGLAASTVTTWISRGLDGDRLAATKVAYRQNQPRYVIDPAEWARFSSAHGITPRLAAAPAAPPDADTVALELQLAMLRSTLVETQAALALAEAQAVSLRARLETVSHLAERQSELLAKVARDLSAPR